MNISLVEWPFLAPGKCVNCGCSTRNDGRKYVDMGLQIPMYGAVYFCEHCIRELAKFFGLVDKTALDTTEDTLREVQEDLERATEENHALRRALSELDFLKSSDSGNVPYEPEPEDNPVSTPEPVVVESGTEQSDIGRPPKAAPRRSTNRPRPSESDDGEGSSGVPGDDLAAIRKERRTILGI